MNSLPIIHEMGLALERHTSDQYKVWKSNAKLKATSIGQLYKLIMTGKYKKDEDLAKAMGYDSANSTYRAIKSELKKELENLFLYVKVKTPKGKPKDHHVKLQFNKEFAGWLNMNLCGAGNAFADRGESLYMEAKRNDFTTEASMILTRIMATNVIFTNKEKYEKYKNEKIGLSKELSILDLGVKYFSKIQNLYANTKATKTYLYSEIEKDYLHFLSEAEGVSTPTIDKYRFLLKIYLHSSINAHNVVFETAKAAIKHYEQFENICVDATKSFNYYLMEGYAKHKDYDMMKCYAEENLELLEEGSLVWFKTIEIYAFCCLHLRQYAKAAELLLLATAHPLYDTINAIARDVFRFIEAHLHLLKEARVFVPAPKSDIGAAFLVDFKFARFASDLEITGDKQGLTIVEILLEIGFSIVRKKSEQLIDRMEAIEKFFQRHTDEEGHERILAFLQLLKLGFKHNWKKSDIPAEALQPHYEALAASGIDFSNQRLDMEFIDYLNFFELLLR